MTEADVSRNSPPRGRRLPGAGVQTKLLIMLLCVSLLSAGIVGAIGFLNGRDSLREAAFNQLTTIRELRTEEIEATFANIQRGVTLDSRTKDSVDASLDFNLGFEQLRTTDIDAGLEADVLSYYEDTFVPALEQRSGQDFEAEALMPNTDAGRYLQAQYTVNSANFDEAIARDDAGDGSSWSAAHAEHHPYLRGLVEQLGYEDVLLLNTTGDVVYSAYKGVDLGVNILAAPYTDTGLSNAYRDVLRTNTVDALATSDFERYVPSLNVPTAWITSPVGTAGAITGVLAVQIPIETINATMTGNEAWSDQGLGRTGEVYLAGPDETMRSVSRQLVQAPEDYAEAAVSGGTPPDIAERVVAINGTVLVQPVHTIPVQSALVGESGISVSQNYLGVDTLAAYAPLDVDGLQWVIVASLDTDEAFAPVTEFTRVLALSTAAIVFLVTLLSLLLAQVFTRPIGRLVSAVNRVTAGERDVQVETGSRDEFDHLGATFNDMSRSLQVKADLLDEQLAENERLLLTLMPQTVADRYRQGDETIAADHADVTVIYGDIVGFDEYAADVASDTALALLNAIVTSFDEAALRLGIEPVRTTKQGYLASCGLLVPRTDSARRSVDFAIEMERILERIGSQRGVALSLRAGIDSGTVTSGLIGRSTVVYDMWGEAVSLAYRLQGGGAGSGVFVTQRVVDRLPDTVGSSLSSTVDTKQGSQAVWKIDTAAAHV
ncbi:MAG: hypothetical protein JWQ43_2606 [Glaciihabitans sp.]|nr:hypothetical protein [Glaciihabitans sp.]